MITPKEAGAALRSYLENVDDDQFREDMLNFNPHLAEELEEQPRPEEPSPGVFPFEAYIASALTLLTSKQRRFVYKVSDIVASVCKRVGVAPYEPRKQTDPTIHPDVTDIEVFRIDRQSIAAADLLITLCDYPSFGGGQELDFAFNSFTPIILISHENSLVSRMVTGIPLVKRHIKYKGFDDLSVQLEESLVALLPLLERHKAMSQRYTSVKTIGTNIRRFRERLQLSIPQLAERSQLLTEDTLELFEEYSDRMANPSLIQLQHLADILNTTVAELLEPTPDYR